jgi:hypothetical protein
VSYAAIVKNEFAFASIADVDIDELFSRVEASAAQARSPSRSVTPEDLPGSPTEARAWCPADGDTAVVRRDPASPLRASFAEDLAVAPIQLTVRGAAKGGDDVQMLDALEARTVSTDSPNPYFGMEFDAWDAVALCAINKKIILSGCTGSPLAIASWTACRTSSPASR